jgi:hypothetical protein
MDAANSGDSETGESGFTSDTSSEMSDKALSHEDGTTKSSWYFDLTHH